MKRARASSELAMLRDVGPSLNQIKLNNSYIPATDLTNLSIFREPDQDEIVPEKSRRPSIEQEAFLKEKDKLFAKKYLQQR